MEIYLAVDKYSDNDEPKEVCKSLNAKKTLAAYACAKALGELVPGKLKLDRSLGLGSAVYDTYIWLNLDKMAWAVTDSIFSLEKDFFSAQHVFTAAAPLKKEPWDLAIERDDGRKVCVSFGRRFEALVRPRLINGVDPVDFGMAWAGHPCSRQYMEAMSRLTAPIGEKDLEDWKSMFDNPKDKWEQLITPALSLFLTETADFCQIHPDAPRKIIGYLFGDTDYYQVSLFDRKDYFVLSAYNPHGTLGDETPVTKFPGRLIEAGFKERGFEASPTTGVLTFENGWEVELFLSVLSSAGKMYALSFTVKPKRLPYWALKEKVKFPV